MGGESREDIRICEPPGAEVRTGLVDRAYAGVDVGVSRTETTVTQQGRAWALTLATSLILLICIRFFSENLRVVPRLAQYIDVPITIVVGFCGVLTFIRRGYRVGGPKYGAVLYAFFLASLVSALVNVSRVELLPVAMFVFNFAAPLVFVVVTINARLSRKDVEQVVRVFFWLGVTQLVVAVLYGLPKFLATKNPDYISGTFGQNAYQFTYFIGLWLLYVLGGVAVLGPGSRRRGQGIAISLAALVVFGLFYAAQYRAMLIFFTAVILVALWASPARASSRIMMTVVISAVSVITLIVVATAFPNLKLLKVFDLFEDSTPIVQSGKVEAFKNVGTMYQDIPQAALVGSGPATFSSRAYIVFSEKPRESKEAVGALIVGMRGGQYVTDVAKKYVQTIDTTAIQGGTTMANPMSSYTSLAAEVGPIGLVVYFSAYLMALSYSYRRLRANARAGNRLGTQLAFACFGGIPLLLVQAFFDNWLETTRVSIPLWILVGLLYALERADSNAGRTAIPEAPGKSIATARWTL